MKERIELNFYEPDDKMLDILNDAGMGLLTFDEPMSIATLRMTALLDPMQKGEIKRFLDKHKNYKIIIEEG